MSLSYSPYVKHLRSAALIVMMLLSAVCLHAQQSEVRRLYAEAFKLQGEYKSDEAISRLHHLLSIDSTCVAAYNLMGYIYEDSFADFDTALYYYKKALAIKPDYAKVYINIGHLHYLQMHYDTALVYINKAIEYDSNYADAYFNLGWIYNSKNNLAQSIHCFRKAARMGSEAAQQWLESYGYGWGDEEDTIPPQNTSTIQKFERTKPKTISIDY